MHIPDNYLSASTCAVLTLATVPVWYHSIRKVRRDFPNERYSALGIAAAFSFLAMMFNVPLPGGSTGHAVGGTLLAILLGPEAACLSLTIALAIQAFLFGDGGVIALGANCFNIAFLLPFGGYFVYSGLRRLLRVQEMNVLDLVIVGMASYVGINLASFATSVEFGLQPLLFHTETGQAMYCPYPLSVSVPAMAVGHLTVFGFVEVVFSVFVYAYVCRTAPDFATNTAFFARAITTDDSIGEEDSAADPSALLTLRGRRFSALYLLLVVLAAASPLGLLAEGTAWGEWGIDEIASLPASDGAILGYTPTGMSEGFVWNAVVPDYEVVGLPGWFGYILSAVAGIALCVILFKLATLFFARADS